MNIDIQVIGLKELVEKLGRATAADTLDETLFKGALLLQFWSQEHRFVSGGGKKYKTLFQRGAVQKDILTSRTGNLRGSITTSRASNRDALAYKIGTPVVYAPVHEFGSAKKNIRPRPFLRPSIENQENINKITQMINKTIQENLK
jgi:phage gpG-like protein